MQWKAHELVKIVVSKRPMSTERLEIDCELTDITPEDRPFIGPPSPDEDSDIISAGLRNTVGERESTVLISIDPDADPDGVERLLRKVHEWWIRDRAGLGRLIERRNKRTKSA